MKRFFIIIGIILILVLLVFIFFLFFMPRGYKPGNLTKKNSPEFFLPHGNHSSTDNYWQVSEGVSLYHTKSGEGEPVLVLHGGPGFPSEDNWKGLELLTGQYSFHYYHQRGSGLSTRPIDRFESKNYYTNSQILLEHLSIEQHIADIERIRRILKVEKLNLIGHSFGGFIAALYAMEFPENVSSLILVSPANMLVMPHESGKDLFALIEQNLKDEDKPEFDHFIKEYFNYGRIFEKSERDLTEMNNRIGMYYMNALKNSGAGTDPAEVKEGYDNGWMTHAIYFSLGRKYDMREQLKRIKSPVLLIHGSKDLVMDLQSINLYGDNLPQKTVYSLSGAGHNSFNDRPEQFASIVGEFLSRHQVGQRQAFQEQMENL